MKKYFTFIGPIAAGKGTQAKIIANKYGLLHLSTGQIFRDAISSGSELGQKVKNIIDSGFLVPDNLTNEVVKDILGKLDLSNGFILDGYPRTINQVYALDDILSELGIPLDDAVMIDIPESEIIKRISGRFACAKCGQNYHDEFNKTKVNGVCDNCGSHDFIRRNDDKPEVIKTRLEHYYSEVEPIIEFYKKQNKFLKIDASNLSIEEVTKQLEELLF